MKIRPSTHRKCLGGIIETYYLLTNIPFIDD